MQIMFILKKMKSLTNRFIPSKHPGNVEREAKVFVENMYFVGCKFILNSGDYEILFSRKTQVLFRRSVARFKILFTMACRE